MTQRRQDKKEDKIRTRRYANARGFSMVELLLVVAVGLILTGIAVPQVKSGMYRYRLNGAVASATWAIQSTRYQALMAGYPYQVVFTKATNEYQIQDLPTGSASYANVGSAVPLSGSATVPKSGHDAAIQAERICFGDDGYAELHDLISRTLSASYGNQLCKHHAFSHWNILLVNRARHRDSRWWRF